MGTVERKQKEGEENNICVITINGKKLFINFEEYKANAEYLQYCEVVARVTCFGNYPFSKEAKQEILNKYPHFKKYIDNEYKFNNRNSR